MVWFRKPPSSKAFFHILAVKSFASLILSLESLQKMEIHYFSETEVVVFFKAEKRRKLI